MLTDHLASYMTRTIGGCGLVCLGILFCHHRVPICASTTASCPTSSSSVWHHWQHVALHDFQPAFSSVSPLAPSLLVGVCLRSVMQEGGVGLAALVSQLGVSQQHPLAPTGPLRSWPSSPTSPPQLTRSWQDMGLLFLAPALCFQPFSVQDHGGAGAAPGSAAPFLLLRGSSALGRHSHE